MIDLKKLRNAIEVANTGSITIAAENRCVTQSTLSRSIADVEAHLGVSLFHRTPNGVIPTEIGLKFIDRAREIIVKVDNLITETSDHKNLREGRLRIGFASAMFHNLVYPSIIRIVKANPSLGVETISGPGEVQVPKLLSEELDLLIGTQVHLGRWAELRLTPIVDLHCRIMVRHDHPLTELETLTPEAVLSYPAVLDSSLEVSRHELHELYRAHGVEPKAPKYLCESVDQFCALIENTDAFSLVYSPSGRFSSLQSRFALLECVLSVTPQKMVIATAVDQELQPSVVEFFRCILRDLNSSN